MKIIRVVISFILVFVLEVPVLSLAHEMSSGHDVFRMLPDDLLGLKISMASRTSKEILKAI